ncbi:MAG: amidotransferase [Bacteroidetes bacterium 4572_77]|nr:MAG: amidotransferase [Bacteroidetes bacterium 4572_77]
MKQSRISFSLLWIFSILLFLQCSHKQEQVLTIAISKAKADSHYYKWVLKADPKAKIINMYPLGIDSALTVLEQCDALLISGGADVYPGRYHKAADTLRCGTIDYYRDSLEIKMIHRALSKKMPLLGICRGEQIINVALGGSLYIDIPSDFDTSVVHRQKDWRNCFHKVDMVANSLLFNICQTPAGLVNSNHHQAVNNLAPSLVASAYSSDGLIEAVEWKDTKNKSFLIGVQWHPERLDSANASLSLPIGREFILQAQEYKNK